MLKSPNLIHISKSLKLVVSSGFLITEAKLLGNSMYNNSKITYIEICNLLDIIANMKNKDYYKLKVIGNEIAMWQDSGKNISDILFECFKGDIQFEIICNGKVFINYLDFEKSFNKFLFKRLKVAKIYLTADNRYEKNKLEKDYSKMLDNFTKYIEKNLFHELLEIYVITTFTIRDENKLSKIFIERYTKLGFNS